MFDLDIFYNIYIVGFYLFCVFYFLFLNLYVVAHTIKYSRYVLNKRRKLREYDLNIHSSL